jgi:hypothetical protein
MHSMFARREFLGLLPSLLCAYRRELVADVAVIGAGTGGCAAALAALRNGLRVVLTEETRWVGGQFTSQAVPPDEHPWIEAFGATRSYREFRTAIRQYYRRHYPLTEAARRSAFLNPGDGAVSRLCHEPKAALAVLESLLAPYLSSGQLTLLLEHTPVAASTAGDRVRAVTVRGGGVDRVITAPYFIDSTEQGDLLPLTGIEFVTGAESQRETGEPHAPAEARPHAIQAFTLCFAMEYRPGEDHTIDKPEEWSFWRDYVPQLQPAWPGKLLSLSYSDPITLKPKSLAFDPTGASAPGAPLNLWLYRRIASKANFTNPQFADITLVNWPQNDYWLGNLHGVSAAEAERSLRRARQLNLSLLYWLQTDLGWKGLRLRPDVTGAADGMAMAPYIRESRRIRAEFTVVEQHVATDLRPSQTAEEFPDSVGVGSYRIDLHPDTAGVNYIDISALPFQIPLGALLPRRVENLLAGAKNLGVTHITNGCYRLHPVEWNIGEAAGCLAAEAIRTKTEPRAIRKNQQLLGAFQRRLVAQGVEIAWPKLRPL